LCAYLRSCFGTSTGISFINSTSLKVFHNRRISQHKVFKDVAARGKTSVDWFFGLKLHLVINDKGELLNFQVTPGNVDDRKPIPELLQHLFGKVFADKGYISQKMFKELMESVGVQVVTKLKRNMKQRLRSLVVTKTCSCRDSYWPTEECFPDWTFPASFSGQLLCQHSLWLDCLFSSTKKARNRYGTQQVVFCLTRTDVIFSSERERNVGCRQQKLIDTVIDTGFNGFISLPSSIITALVLDDLILADAEIQAAIQN
jgi:hypothetical protein